MGLPERASLHNRLSTESELFPSTTIDFLYNLCEGIPDGNTFERPLPPTQNTIANYCVQPSNISPKRSFGAWYYFGLGRSEIKLRERDTEGLEGVDGGAVVQVEPIFSHLLRMGTCRRQKTVNGFINLPYSLCT